MSNSGQIWGSNRETWIKSLKDVHNFWLSNFTCLKEHVVISQKSGKKKPQKPTTWPSNFTPGYTFGKTTTTTTLIWKDTCTLMFRSVLLTMAKMWKQPKCPSTDEQWKKMWFRYTVDYHSIRQISGFPGGSAVKNLPEMQETPETQVPSLGQEDPLEEGMAAHSSGLAWRIPMDRGAWRATVRGVTKSQTRLKWRSSSRTIQLVKSST